MKILSLRFNRLFLLFFTVCIIFAFISAMPQTFAQDSTMSYKLANLSDGSYTYTINIVVPQSLIEHYQGLSHLCWFDFTYPKFVTPYAFQPVADCLRQIYIDDEVFTNQVLTLVHQIPYNVIGPVYYPAETLTMNIGDCDLFSLIAASILKAGGLDVVLFRYVDEPHMNIGVHLAQKPQNTRTPVYSAKYENLSYYIAECTSTDWQNGWRVGECPKSLQNASVAIINTKLCEQTSPTQVAVSIEGINQDTNQNTDLIPPIPILPHIVDPTPLPITPDTSDSIPSSAPFPPPFDPTTIPIPTPTPRNPSPHTNETSTVNSTPNPTPESTQTVSPSITAILTPTPVPTPDTSNNPTSTSTPTATPIPTFEQTSPQTNPLQPTQQQVLLANTIYAFIAIGITTTIIVTGILLIKKVKASPR